MLMLSDAAGGMLYLKMIRRRLVGWKQFLGILAIMTVEICMAIMAQEIPDYYWVPSMIASLGRMYLFCCPCTEKNIFVWGLYLVRAFILAELAAFIQWHSYTYVTGYWKLHPGICVLLLGMILLFYCSVACMELWQFPEERTWKKRILEILPVVNITGIVFMIFYTYLIIARENVTENTELPLFRICIDIAGFVLLYIYTLIYNERTARKEIKAMELIIQKQYQQYQMAQDSVNLINQKYHDFKHQIELLRKTESNEKRNAYLDKLQEDIENYEAFSKTGNPVLDTIITSNHLRCRKENIVFTSVADGKLLNFIDTMDICSIFGNILENAIEYERTIKEQKRIIHLSVSAQKGFLFIKSENYYEGKKLSDEALPQTTKEDKTLHGFGLKSIQKTAEKYNGKMTVGIKENWFEIRILIPLKE